MPNFIDRNFDSPLDLARPLGPPLRLAPPRRLRATSPSVVAPPLRRRAAAAAVQLPGDVRRPGARTRPSPSTPSSPTWTPSPGSSTPRAACTPSPPRLAVAAEKAGGELRYGADGRAHRAGRGHLRARSAACASTAASSSPPTPSWQPRPARSPTGPCSPGLDAPRVARRGRYSPSCAGVARRRAGRAPARASPTTTSTSARPGTSSFRALLADGRPHARPVDPRDRAHRRRPGHGPAGLLARSTSSSRCPTSTAASTGPPSAPRLRPTAGRPGRRPRLPRRRRGRGASSTPSTGSAQGMERGTPFALSPPVPPDRPVPPGERRAPGPGPRVRRLGHPCPAWACPMVLLSGRLAAERVDGAGVSRRDRDHARGSATRGAGSSTGARHHLLLVDPGAAPGQAPPRARRLRLLPPRRRHRRRPRRHGVAGRAGRGARRLRRPVLRRPRAGDGPTTTVLAGRGPHRPALRHRPRLLPALPAVDGHGPHRRPLRDVGRPAAATWTARPR